MIDVATNVLEESLLRAGAVVLAASIMAAAGWRVVRFTVRFSRMIEELLRANRVIARLVPHLVREFSLVWQVLHNNGMPRPAGSPPFLVQVEDLDDDLIDKLMNTPLRRDPKEGTGDAR